MLNCWNCEFYLFNQMWAILYSSFAFCSLNSLWSVQRKRVSTVQEDISKLGEEAQSCNPSYLCGGGGRILVKLHWAKWHTISLKATILKPHSFSCISPTFPAGFFFPTWATLKNSLDLSLFSI
jgi:hypothetical protein